MKRTVHRKNQFILLTVTFILILAASLVFGAFFVSAREDR